MSPAAASKSFSASVGVQIGRVDQRGNDLDCGYERVHKFQPLCRLARRSKLTPVGLPPGRERLATRPSWTGSSATRKTIGGRRVAALPPAPQVYPPLQSG